MIELWAVISLCLVLSEGTDHQGNQKWINLTPVILVLVLLSVVDIVAYSFLWTFGVCSPHHLLLWTRKSLPLHPASKWWINHMSNCTMMWYLSTLLTSLTSFIRKLFLRPPDSLDGRLEIKNSLDLLNWLKISHFASNVNYKNYWTF